LHFLQQRGVVPDPRIGNDNESPPLRSRRYDDSSDDSSDNEDESPHITAHKDDGEDEHYNSPTVVYKKPTRRAFINHAFVEAVNLSRDFSPLSQEEYQYFTPTKLEIYHSCNTRELPIVIDSSASVTVTPVLSDFVGPLRASRLASLQGVAAKSIVVGGGTICWSIRDAIGHVHQLWIKA
jgi:hypothetical protein